MTAPALHCHQCGASLQPTETRGLCPACVLETSLKVEDDADSGGLVEMPWPDLAAKTPPASVVGAFQNFGEYELLGEIGRGGMGVIFRARHRKLNRVAALKMVLAGPLGSPDFAGRFQTEARAAAGLDHPHIVPIYEVGETEGQQFYTMRLVEGLNLAQRLKEFGCPEPRQAAAWLRSVAHAVHYAHQRGVLHRDLKPANILLDADDQPHVTDFGLAKLMEEESGLTLSQAALGTPNYMSPEQASGKVKSLTVGADVYSLGAVFWETLTGSRLFEGPSPLATINQVLEKEPPRPSLLNPAVPRDLDTICLKCLQKEPGRRYESALDFAEDLERWIRGEPIRARRVGLRERVWLWCRRKPALAGLAGASLAVLAGVSTVAIWNVQAAREREALERYARSISQTDQAIQDGAMDLALTSLLDCPDQLRHWEWGRLLYECLQEVSSISAHTNRAQLLGRPLIKNLAFDKQGLHLATTGLDGSLAVWDPIKRRELFRLMKSNNQVTSFSFRPGHAQIAVGRLDGSLDLLASDSGERVLRLIAASDAPAQASPDPVIELNFDVYDFGPIRDPLTRRPWVVTGVEWDPEGERLAIVRKGGVVTVRSAEEEGHAWVWLPPSSNTVARSWFTPDGGDVVIQSDGLAQRFDARSGEPRQALRWDAGEVDYGGAVVAPRGDRVVLISRDWRATLLHSERGTIDLGPLLLRTGNSPRTAFFSADGAYFCISAAAGAGGVFQADTGELHFVLPSAVYGGAFSSDSSQLAVFGPERIVRIWDVRHRLELRALRGHLSSLTQVSYDPSGRLIATSSREGVVKVWTARFSGDVLFGETLTTCSGYSPDGKWLATGPAWRGVELWEARTGHLQWSRPSRTQLAYTMIFSPDSDLLYVAGSDRHIRILRVADGKSDGMLTGHATSALTVACSPDRGYVASGDLGGTVIVWDAKKRTAEHTLIGAHPGPVWSLSFDLKSRWLVTAGAGRPRVWDIQSGECLMELTEDGSGTLFANFTPDGGRVIAACLDHRIRVWEMPSGQLIDKWPSQTQGSSYVSHTPDGQRFAVVMSDFSALGYSVPKVEIWDANAGRLLLRMTTHLDSIYSASFDVDAKERRLVTASMDTTVRQWEAFPWKDRDYPDPKGGDLAQRIRHFAERYWQERLGRTTETTLASGVSEIAVLPPGIPEWERDRWPVRAPYAQSSQINLDRYYTGVLDACFYPNLIESDLDDDLSDFPVGLRTLQNVTFDVRGVVWLRSEYSNPAEPRYRAVFRDYPDRVEGIAIGQRYRKLRVLHAATTFRWARPSPLVDSNGRSLTVAAYVLHYADGTQYEHEVIYGRDLRHWWWGARGDEEAEAELATVAWVGTNSLAQKYECKVRLFLSTFENPKPDVEVTAIDFVSKLTPVAPFLVAMTVEE